MTNKNSNLSKNNVSRRKFLKGGAILGATVGLSSLTGGKATEQIVEAFGKKQLDEFPVEMSSDFKRFDQKNTVFNRYGWDSSLGLKRVKFFKMDTQPGYLQKDSALDIAAWSVENGFAINSKYGTPKSPLYAWEGPVVENKASFESKEEASKVIKKAAKFLGADLVGITEYDEKWVYDPLYSVVEGEIAPDFPFKPKSVIVMAIEMDYDSTKTSPSYLGNASTGLGYSNMATTAYSVATYLRQLGYKAFGCGNDVSESVPQAIAAGLGELGRNGLLLTQEYGPRVRLCKVFTEMELAYDKPTEFGGMKFCEVCKRCADACPSESIPFDTERNFNTKTISNQPGMKKWYVNVESCFGFWCDSDSSCSVCIAACPYNKPNFWHHRLTSAMTSTPIKPFLKSMDELFGYGHTFDEQAAIDFWERD